MNQYKTIAIIALIVAGGLLSWFVFGNNSAKIAGPLLNETDPNAQTGGIIKLGEQTNNEGSLSIGAKPVDFTFGKPVQIEITFTTHQGDLNFDPAKQAVLVSDDGQLQPVSWSGRNGGHHLRGILAFPQISKDSSKMTLIIRDIYGVKERTFLWNLI